MPQTQWEAYQKLRVSGALAASEGAVLEMLASRPGLTRNELDLALGHGRPNANASRRLSAMERKGVLRRGDRRRCSVTSNKCETWFVVDQLPSEVPPKKSVQRRSLASAVSKLSKLLNHPRAQLFPDATLEAARSILEGLDVDKAEASS